MKLALLLAVAAAASAAVPAMADTGQIFDWRAQQAAFSTAGPSNEKQCFNGKYISGANRAGLATLYVQPSTGGVYKVRLLGDCDAVNAAQKITLRSGGSDAVCDRQPAEVVMRTPTGAKSCHASEVRRLTSREVAALAKLAER